MHTLELEVGVRRYIVNFTGYAEQDDYGPAGQYLAYPEIEEVFEEVDDGDQRRVEFNELSPTAQMEIEDAAANVLVNIERSQDGEGDYYE